MTLVPAAVFLLFEGALRFFDYGHPTDFFIPGGEHATWTTNQQFGWRFFPPAIARSPEACELADKKPSDGFRIFVLGGSAAMGIPDPAFGLGRILEVMLQERFPDAEFEVVNAAMTAVNSHAVLPIARDCAAHDADLLVVYMGNNEVYGPYGPGTVFCDFSPSLSVIRTSIYLKSTKTGQLLENLVHPASQGAEHRTHWKGMEMVCGNRVAADDPRLQSVYGHFRENLRDLCDVADCSGAGLILCTVATNLADSAPFGAEHRAHLSEAERADWEAACKVGIALAEANSEAQALEHFLKAAAIDDRRADLQFRMGRCLLALGQSDEARRHFTLARDLDVLRFRADTPINAAIREVAAEKAAQGVHLVDIERAFELQSGTPAGPPDRGLFYEHVHLTPEGNYLLAKMVFEQVVTLLPDGIRSHGSDVVAAPSAERCFLRLALTDWDRYRMAAVIADLLSRPPFTAQIDHQQQLARHRRSLAGLARQGCSPAALRDACRVYEAALEGACPSPALRQNYATLLTARGDCQGAAEQWRLLLARFPDMATWHVELGKVLQGQREWAAAIAEFQAAMRINPYCDAVALYNIGTALLEQGEPEQAAVQLRRSLAVDPELARTHNNLGLALLDQGKPKEAIDCFRKALDLEPDIADAHNNLGLGLAEQGDLTEAEKHYREALAIDPGNRNAHHNLASLLGLQGKGDALIQLHRQAAEFPPQQGDVQVAHDVAVALTKSGRVADAIRQYRAVLGLDPDYVPALSNLARILATHDRPDFRDGPEAVRLMERACRGSKGEDPKLLDTLAAAYAEAGRLEDAVATATRALQRARAEHHVQLVPMIEHHLSLYKQGKPFHWPWSAARR